MSTEAFIIETEEESGSTPILTLLTITHSTLITPIYCVLNNENVISNSIEYIAYPFKFEPPKFRKDGIDPGSITIENIDGAIVEALRTAAGAEEPKCTFSFVLANDLNTVQRTWPSLLLTSAKYTDTITGSLQYPQLNSEPYTKYYFNDVYFPGL